MKKVLIPTKLDSFAADFLRGRGAVVVQDASKPIEELAVEHADAEALIVRSEKVTQAVIDALPKLRLVVRAGAGYNTIDTKYARRRSVDVMNTPGANANAVAEEVVAMVLAAFRHIVDGHVTTKEGKWEKKRLMGRELAGKTVGVIGLGNIGRLLVKRLEGFENRVLGYDPMISADFAERLGVELCSLDRIFSESDIISLHIPENDETRGIVGRKLLSLTKKGAVLVNCARAGIVNEDDLRALKAERSLVFCNDVYPKDEAGDKSVADIADIMLPHLGASTEEANFVAAKRAAEQTVAYFEKGVNTHVVNKGVPDGLDERFQALANVLAKLARNYLGKNRAPHRIETSFYGDLGKFHQWMLVPITAGITNEFDPYLDAADAEAFLVGRGIDFRNREVDDSKKYGQSMTIDLFEGDKTINKVSVRGTIAEGNLMIARVNNYEHLYLEPSGHNLFIEYGDAPGVIGKIASILGENKINIIDIRAPQDLRAGTSLTVVKTNTAVQDDIVQRIAEAVGASNAFAFSHS